MSDWTQSAMETAIEIALLVQSQHVCDASQDEVDEAGGISQWIQDRTVEFEEQHKYTDWSIAGDFYDEVYRWLVAYNVAKRMEGS